MRIACFAFNRKERAFFEKIAPHLDAELDIIYVNRRYAISHRATKVCNKADLHEANDLKLRFEQVLHPTLRHTPFASLYRYYIRIVSRYLCMKYGTILSAKNAESPYDLLMIWSGVTYRQAIATEVARKLGMRTLFIENGLLPNTFVMDPAGVNFRNSLPRTPDFYRNYRPPRSPLPRKLIPRAPKQQAKFVHKEAPLPENYLFIPFQVDYDTQLLMFSDWIDSMQKLFTAITEVSERIKDRTLHFVFKEHPSSLLDYPDLHALAEQNPRLHFANHYPTQHLIEHARGIVTVNSTVGIESLLLNKKVILLGKAFYAIDGLTQSARDIRSLCTIVDGIEEWQVDETLRDHFLKYLYFEYLVPGSFVSESPKQYAKINEILRRLQSDDATPPRRSPKQVAPDR